MTRKPVIVWFRRDLRLADNPALLAAVDRGGPVIPVYIWAADEDGDWQPGAASRWWLHQSLTKLADDLESVGSRLLLRRGASSAQLQRLIKETSADMVAWNRLYEPAAVQRDQQVEKLLGERGVESASFNAALLFEPWKVETKQGKPFQVFTPFWKACRSSAQPEAPLQRPNRIPAPQRWPDSVSLESLSLEPEFDWAGGIRREWQPGAAGAKMRLKVFLREIAADYKDTRDRPCTNGTSRLSPHLHFGEIGPREVWHAVKDQCSNDRRTREGKSAEVFLSELGWREFAHHVLYHFPHTVDKPLRKAFEHFPWSSDRRALRAWRKARTGYPIVDAGMRELWTTGWMHNRVRMIVGSFLAKDLLISWRDGANWFWDTLVDADLANNTLGWQWISGCGADAAPYFRIFNPVSQGEKFDSEGAYVRRWVPELKKLPTTRIHQPWNASNDELKKAGVVLGETYPRPIVDHREARKAALEAFEVVKGR